MKVLHDNNYFIDECPYCHSELGIHVGDIRYNEMAHHCSSFEVTCGACERVFGISSRKIPAGWMLKIIPED